MKINPTRTALAALAALATTGTLALTPAITHADPAASSGHRDTAGRTAPGGWERLPSEGFVSPAGDLCGFGLRSTTRFDRVFVRTTRTFADGSPRRQAYAGPLVVGLTNQRTGTTVQRDLSGRAVATYRRDGSYDFAISGPAAVGFHEGDGLSKGYYVLRGFHVVRFAADGTRTVIVDRGSESNVCRDLR